jgi:hypothetical protein
VLSGCEPDVSALQLSLLDARALEVSSAGCGIAPSERLGVEPAWLDDHYPTTARRPVPAALVRELRQPIATLPGPVARAFARHVCRVVLATGLGAAGTLKMSRDDPSRGVIVLNLDYLEQSADAWMSAKEASFFEPDAGLTIFAHMAAESDRGALLGFLLTHELGHVLHSALYEDPEVERLVAISWPRQDALAGLRLVPYAALRGQAPLAAALVEPMYEMVAASSLPSLTAAAHETEDFADSVATYAHDVLRGRPWSVEVYRGNERSAQLGSCWREPRCQDKRAALEALLARF